MPRQKTRGKLGRPFLYTSEDERPVTVSLRIPHALAEQMQRYAARHRQTITELLIDGLKWRLEQDGPCWPAQNGTQYYDNTVLREFATPAHLLDDRIPFDEGLPPAPTEPTEGQQAPTGKRPQKTALGAAEALEPSSEGESAASQQHGVLVLAGPEPGAPTAPSVEHPAPGTRARPQALAPHIHAIAEAKAQYDKLSLADFSQLLFDRNIYRATDRRTGEEKPVNRGTLQKWLKEAEQAGLL